MSETQPPEPMYDSRNDEDIQRRLAKLRQNAREIVEDGAPPRIIQIQVAQQDHRDPFSLFILQDDGRMFVRNVVTWEVGDLEELRDWEEIQSPEATLPRAVGPVEDSEDSGPDQRRQSKVIQQTSKKTVQDAIDDLDTIRTRLVGRDDEPLAGEIGEIIGNLILACHSQASILGRDRAKKARIAANLDAIRALAAVRIPDDRAGTAAWFEPVEDSEASDPRDLESFARARKPVEDR